MIRTLFLFLLLGINTIGLLGMDPPEAKQSSLSTLSPDQRLLQAAILGDYNEMKIALQLGANPNVTNEEGTALWIVVMRRHNNYIGLIRLLFYYGAHINPVNSKGITLLQWTVNNNMLQQAQCLVQYGAKPIVSGSPSFNQLSHSAILGDIDTVRRFLALAEVVNVGRFQAFDQSAQIGRYNCANDNLHPAILYAIGHCQIDIIRILIYLFDWSSKQADTFTTYIRSFFLYNKGFTDAERARYRVIFNMLCQAKEAVQARQEELKVSGVVNRDEQNPDEEIQSPINQLIDAISRGDSSCVRQALENGANVETLNSAARSALELAAHYKDPVIAAAMVNDLLNAGAYPNPVNLVTGDNLLHTIAHRPEICKLITNALKLRYDIIGIAKQGLPFYIKDYEKAYFGITQESDDECDSENYTSDEDMSNDNGDSSEDESVVKDTITSSPDAIKAIEKHVHYENQSVLSGEKLTRSDNGSSSDEEQTPKRSEVAPDKTLSKNDLLIKAILSGNLDLLNQALSAEADVETLNSAARSALELAAHYNDPQIAAAMVEALLDAGAYPYPINLVTGEELLHEISHRPVIVRLIKDKLEKWHRSVIVLPVVDIPSSGSISNNKVIKK